MSAFRRTRRRERNRAIRDGDPRLPVGQLAAFSPDGSEEWSVIVQDAIRGIGIADDVLYVGTQKGTLYAYRPLDFP